MKLKDDENGALLSTINLVITAAIIIGILAGGYYAYQWAMEGCTDSFATCSADRIASDTVSGVYGALVGAFGGLWSAGKSIGEKTKPSTWSWWPF